MQPPPDADADNAANSVKQPRRIFCGIYNHPQSQGVNIEVDLATLIRNRAEQGDAEAQFQCSVMYQDGELITQDLQLARQWLHKAAEQGHFKAMYNLGVIYAEGLGVKVDYVEAIKWYRAAAAEGEPRAYHNLGSFYINGLGTTVDGPQANKHWHEAAVRGLSQSQANLAFSLASGDGGKVDLPLAFIWAYISRDKEPTARLVLESLNGVFTDEQLTRLKGDAELLIVELSSLNPRQKAKFNQED